MLKNKFPMLLANNRFKGVRKNKGFRKKHPTMGHVVVVGLGYVGLPLSLLADRKGYRLTGIDTNSERVSKINSRLSPFIDGRLAVEVASSGVYATNDFSTVKDADVVVVCVPTPVDEDHEPNLGPLIGACKSIAPYLHSGQLVIIESTINPGVSEDVIIPVLEKESGLIAGKDFYIAHCPERINPGDPHWNVSNIPRVVGSLEENGLNKAIDFYRSVVDAEIKPMSSLKEAEAVKIIENCFRDVNIAFVNELAMSFSHLGIDVVKVIEGASTKPFAFMPHFPGCGVGGHCIPVDPYYLIRYAKEKGFAHDFLSMARKINNGMPEFTINLLVKQLEGFGMKPEGVKIAILGLSYKSDVDDDRESPSYRLIEQAEGMGMKVVTHDPYVKGGTASTLDAALEGATAVIVATAHSEFRSITPEFLSSFGVRVVIDGRNCLNKDTFVGSEIIYQGIGR